MRDVRSLNRDWRFVAGFREDYLSSSAPLDGWEPVCLPHTVKELPLNGFDEGEYQFVSCYARDLELPALGPGARVFLDFGGVMSVATAWVDGKPAGSHEGGFTPFSLEISGLVAGGGRHRLVVRVDSTERADIPPFGHVVDYLCFGGVYREVALRIQESAYLEDCFARPLGALLPRKRLELDALVDLGTAAGRVGECARRTVRCVLSAGGRAIGEAEAPLGVEGDSGAASLAVEGLEGVRPWDVDDPALYDLEVSLREGGRSVDALCLRVGFREAEFRSEGFFLNGRRLPLVGLNRHQGWPYVGFAMPARAQRRDAEILKRELGLNVVRTSHYPQSVHFLDACDELGLLVFEELPGWAHIGDAAWKGRACRALEEMIRRDRSRPSICLWGVRVNESGDDGEFYRRTNEIAHRLDPTRQTGGVRFIRKSEFLEDVYTFNDFTHSGGRRALLPPRKATGLGRDVPFLVTEHNGHMFPTKRFDNEERLAEQALRHARVLEAARALPGVSGAIGWCAFDYNTHKDFGSGDRVCYHGVMDMFRVPKYAAWLYASQRPISEGVVLEAASLFSKGERQAARLLPVQVYTNCDEVALYRNGSRIGTYGPDRARFPSLEHPPVEIDDLIGDRLEAEPFSPPDRERIRRLAAKALREGVEAFSPLEYLRLGLLMLRYRMSMRDAETLIGKYALGWGSEQDDFELAGIIGGAEVARRTYGGDARAARLAIAADDAELAGGDWDTTRVTLRLEDQYGNLCPFAQEAVELSVSGPGGVIGPSLLPVVGGSAAFWIRTSGASGRIEASARGSRFASGTIAIEVR